MLVVTTCLAQRNRQPASDQLLTTAPWTNNERGNGFSTMDVTSVVKQGANVLGVALGAGWRDVTSFKRLDKGEAQGDATERVLWAELHILDASGSESVVISTSTGTWSGAQGPVIYDSVRYRASLFVEYSDRPTRVCLPVNVNTFFI